MRGALKAVIDLVEVSELLDLPKSLEHHLVEECEALFNCNGTYRKTQKSKLIQKLSLRCVDQHEPYTALIDLGMIWRMATPSAEDRQTDTHTHDGIPYKWFNYVQRLSSIIRACHIAAERIICGNDPYNAAHTQLKITSET